MNNPSQGKGALKDDPRLRPYFKSEGERRALYRIGDVIRQCRSRHVQRTLHCQL